jgi:RNA polymerase sigma factor (sigma-70 family)
LRKQYKHIGKFTAGKAGKDPKEIFHRTMESRNLENEWIGTEDDKWWFNDVVKAMMPSIVHLANKYTGARSKKYTMSDAINDATLGISQHWMRDLGKSAFTSRAWQAMQAAIKDGLNQTIMGKKSEGGTRELYDKSVSIDAPTGGEGDETYASGLAASQEGDEQAEQSSDRLKLIDRILNDPDINLSDRQTLIIRAKFGIGLDGKPSPKGPKSTTEIANLLGISEVSVRNNYKKALSKIQAYMGGKAESEEEAMNVYQVENRMIIKAMFKVLAEMARIEMAMISETQEVKVQVPVNGVMRNATAIVITDSLEVDNIIAENDESVMMYAGRDIMREAVEGAKALISEEYFSEMADAVIGIHTQPVLAVIGAEPEEIDIGKANKEVVDKLSAIIQNSIS